MKGCFFFVIDSYAPNYVSQLGTLQSKSIHSVLDYIIKPTAWESIDVLLASNRLKTLQSLGIGYNVRGSMSEGKFVPSYTERYQGGSWVMYTGWRRYNNPIFSFGLFDPELPWERASENNEELSETAIAQEIDDPFAAAFGFNLEHRQHFRQAAPTCVVWHIQFERLRSVSTYTFPDGESYRLAPIDGKEISKRSALITPNLDGEVMTTIDVPELPERIEAPVAAIATFRDLLWTLSTNLDTNYRLVGPTDCSPEFLQEALFAVGQILVTEDRDALEKSCSWFGDMGLNVECPKPKPSLSSFTSGDGYALLTETGKRTPIPLFFCGKLPQ